MLAGVGEIDRERPGAPPERLERRGGLLAVGDLARRDDHVRARLGEAGGDVAADAAAAAGDERGATREVEELLDAHARSSASWPEA